MKKQRKNKILATITVIIMVISMLMETGGIRSLRKIKIANNQIEETAVGGETLITPEPTKEEGETAKEETQVETPTPEVEPTIEPTPITEQTPKTEETSSPSPALEESPEPNEEELEIEEENQPIEEAPPQIDESKGNEYTSEDDLIYSNKYIVTMDTIERINPKTAVEEFLKNITITEGNTVKILKGEEEITSGYIATGMKIQGSNGRIYKTSVRGDITGEGIADQVELTMIIRHLVGEVGSKLEGINYSSGDITGDGKIDIVDVNKMINYIVYGLWDYEEIKNPNPPTIEVTGEKDEINNYYKNKVEIQIKEDKTTVNSKTTYKIIGLESKEETIIGEEEKITIEGEGVYLITAYTYGIKGNRSKGSNRIIKIKQEEGSPKEAEYTETIYEMDLKGEYKQTKTETKTGEIGKEITVEVSPKEGFTYNEDLSTITGIIAEDGLTKIEIYYTRNKYKYTIQPSKGVTLEQDSTKTGEYYYGETININAKTDEGYTWEKWISSNEELVESTEEEKITFTMPTGEITIIAKVSINEYKISYNLDGGIIEEENPNTYTVETEDITLKNPTKEGYTFLGWTGSNGEVAREEVTIEKGSIGEKEYIAKWEINKYKITYNLDGGKLTKTNPSTYTIETDDITLNNPTKEGYTFLGWAEGESEETREEVTIAKGSIGEKTYTAKWEVNGDTPYKVNHYKMDIEGNYPETPTNIEEKTGETNRIVTGKSQKQELEGFTYDGEKSTNRATIKADGTTEINIYYERNKYTLNLEAGEGISKVTGQDTYYYEKEITIKAEVKTGYTWENWTSSNEEEIGNKKDEEVIITMPAENITLTANAKINEYKISYNLDGGVVEEENPNTYTVETEDITLNNPTKEGYTFLGWTGSNGEVAREEVTIAKGSTGNKEYIARWSNAEEYTITYNLDGGVVEEANPSTYTVETEDITLNNPTKEGYTFLGWTGSNGEVAREEVTIAKGSTGEKEYTAKWEINKYKITYNLNGGKLTKTNPITYTIETEDITLNNPTKEGYKFLGWTGSNGEVAREEVTIAKGSTGNKEYIANWEANGDTPYKVNHYKMDKEGNYLETPTDIEEKTGETNRIVTGEGQKQEYKGFTYDGEKSTNRTTIKADGTTEINIYYERNKYTLNLEAGEGINKITGQDTYYYEKEITIKAEVKTGYTWENWTSSNEEEIGNKKDEEVIITMPAENITLTANAKINEYTIEYNLNGGVVEEANPSTYTVKTDDITLNNPTKPGYEFLGWTGSNGENPSTTVTIEKGSTGNKEYTANWSNVEEYTITYNLDGGVVEEANPSTYTVETENITLNNPTKEGYTFLGWTGSNGENPSTTVTIEKGSTGNKEYTANWSDAEEYTITYNLDGGVVEEANPSTYTVETENITLNNPTKPGYEFLGWTGSNGENPSTTVTIEKGSTGNKEYTANWDVSGFTITVHHIEKETNEKIAKDETYTGQAGEQYNITDLTTIDEESTREKINKDKYYYIETQGQANGAFTEETNGQEITFIYGINKFEITSEQTEGGLISEIEEVVKYGENSTKEITITPDEGKRVESIQINGKEIEFTKEENTETITLPVFENVTENKTIKAIFIDIPMVVQITESPVQDLIGKKYETLAKALTEIQQTNLNAGSNETTIQIIANIPNEQNDIENQNIKIDLNGHTILSTSDKATITINNGRLTIIDSLDNGGKIINKTTSALEIGETGILTIGQDDKTISQTSPTIEGENYGINAKGEFNYFDGKIIGNTAINGDVNDLPYLKNPGVTREEGKQVAILVTVSDAEATIGKKIFAKLELAIDYANKYIAEDGSQVEIVIVKDLTKLDPIEVGESKNIKLDLNGYTTSIKTAMTNKGKLEITDTSEESRGIITSDTEISLLNTETGTIKMSGGTIRATNGIALQNSSTKNVEVSGGKLDGNVRGILNDNTGDIIINGGTIIANVYTGIWNIGSGNIIMDAGSIQGNGNCWYGIETVTGSVTINGGTISTTNNGKAAIYSGSADVTIYGGTIISGQYGIHNHTTGLVVVNDGIINANRGKGIYNENYQCTESIGIIKINGGTITGFLDGVFNAKNGNNYKAGIIEITGGTINTIQNVSSTHGIYNADTGNLIVNNANITSNGIGISNNGDLTINESQITGYFGGIENYGLARITGGTIKETYNGMSSYGINNLSIMTIENAEVISSNHIAINNGANGNITIENSRITGKTNGIENAGIMLIETGEIISTNNYGINNTGTITLGCKDGEVNIENPIVKGTYGIYNTGIFNFYDGKVTGNSNQSIRGNITDREENYNLQIIVNEDTTETIILGQKIGLIKINETIYQTLQEAVNASNIGDTIEYTANAIIDEQVSIPEEKSVIIDLKGHEIKQYEKIINNGNLTITDSSIEKIGLLNQNTTKIIENKTGANLTIQSGIIQSNTGTSIINEEGAIFTIQGGTIKSTISGVVNLIENNGEMEISEGIINETGDNAKAIWNRENGILKITGGVIETSGKSSTFGVYNIGLIEMTGGKINTTVRGSGSYAYDSGYGIFNAEQGVVNISGGEIIVGLVYSFDAYNATTRGIYNRDSATLTVTGGSINTKDSNRSSKGYAIQNDGSGLITIQDGSISGKYQGITNNHTAKLIVKGGRIEGAVCGINNANAGEVIVTGGIITSNQHGINNTSTGEVTVEDGVITGVQQGIKNDTTGVIIVTGGKITATNGEGIKNVTTGTVTIGQKDANVSITNPAITGATYGVYNQNGTFNFYDGIIKGAQNISIYGAIKEQEEEYDVIKQINEDNTESATLQRLPIAKIISTNEEYYTINEAIGNVQEGEEQTIQILRNADISGTAQTIVVPENKNIILDLNGKTLAFGNTTPMENNGNLEIADKSVEKTGEIKSPLSGTSNDYFKLIGNNGEMKITGGILNATGSYSTVIYNTGKITMEEGIISAKKINLGDNYGIKNDSTATLIINGGTIETSGNYNTFGVYNKGLIEMTGGKINTELKSSNSRDNGYGIHNAEQGVVNVSGGEIIVTATNMFNDVYDTARGIYNRDSATLTVTGGSINTKDGNRAEGYAIQNDGSGLITIEDGSIIGKNQGITNNHTAKLIVKGGRIEGAVCGVNNTNAGEVIVTGGEITSNQHGINNTSTGEVTVEDGVITGVQQGIKNDTTGVIIVTGGEVTSTNGEGIKNVGAGEITIGQKDANVSITNPAITGATYGVYNQNGTFNFYDGIIKGVQNISIYGAVTNKEEGYDIIKETNEDNTESATLQRLPIAKIISTNEEYYTINEAIEGIQEGEEQTIQMLRNADIVATAETIVVPENKSIILDLNGKILNMGKSGQLENQGTLTITDTSNEKTGAISSTVSGANNSYFKLIENSGEMKITGGALSTTGGYSKVIYSTGKVTIEEGIISAKASNSGGYIYGIDNGNTGELIITGGTVETSGIYRVHGIHSAGTVKMSGGLIKTEVKNSNTYDYGYGIYNIGEGKVDILGGEINIVMANVYGGSYDSGYGIYNNDKGIVTVTGGRISANNYGTRYGIWNGGAGVVTVNEVNISGCNYGIQNGGTGSVTVTGGRIEGAVCGINNVNAGAVIVTGGIITSNQHGINNTSTGEVTVEDGVITGVQQGIKNDTTGVIIVTGGEVTSTNGEGIKNVGAGEITIGEKDKNVSITNPAITGATYGVYNKNGSINFYDGVITGETAIYGEVVDVEKEYELNITDSGTKATLKKATIESVESVASVGLIYYNTFKEAISSIDEGIIVVRKDVTIGEKIVIPAGKNITLDLNDCIITYNHVVNPVIEVEEGATLTIVDNGEDGVIFGKIENLEGIAIKNEGTLIVQVADEAITGEIIGTGTRQ